MSDRLKGKVAVVTAAGQGIGRAAALSLAAAGAKVIATDINNESLETLAAECHEIQVNRLDVLDEQQIIAFAKQANVIDILFNCAGFVHHGSILDCSNQDWDFSFDLNVKSMFQMVKAFLPTMLNNGGASIINMSSIASSVKGLPNRFVYGASKAAVIGMTKAIASDYAKQGIRVNAICPGTVDSPSWEERVQAQGGDINEVRDAFIARQPIGRLGTVEEIAALVVYLASDESAYTTGAIHIIDGGLSI